MGTCYRLQSSAETSGHIGTDFFRDVLVDNKLGEHSQKWHISLLVCLVAGYPLRAKPPSQYQSLDAMAE